MALIKSTLLAQVSGSINGATFSHNKGGAYIRNRSIPSNPGTDRQDQVRTALTSLSKMWAEALTEVQRESWRLYGAAVTVINRIGDPIHLSGIAAFNRVNLFRMATLGLAPTLDPPVMGTGDEVPIPAFESFEFLNPVPAEAQLTTTSDVAGFGAIIYFSGALSPGIRYYRGPYSGFVAFPAPTPPSTIFAVSLPAGITAGMSIGCKIILYNIAQSLKVWEVYVDPQIVPAA